MEVEPTGKWGLFVSLCIEIEDCPSGPTIFVFGSRDEAIKAAIEIAIEAELLAVEPETGDLLDGVDRFDPSDDAALTAAQETLGASEYLHVYECCTIIIQPEARSKELDAALAERDAALAEIERLTAKLAEARAVARKLFNRQNPMHIMNSQDLTENPWLVETGIDSDDEKEVDDGTISKTDR